jgi:Predicted transcriptional regulator
MKTRVQDTSIEAYRKLRNLGARQRQVLDLITAEPMSNMDLSKTLGVPINQVTPRTKELRDLGLVEARARKICPYTHRRVIVWGRAKELRISENLSLFESAPAQP